MRNIQCLAAWTSGGFNENEKPATTNAEFAPPSAAASSARGGGAFGNGVARGGRGAFRGFAHNTTSAAPEVTAVSQQTANENDNGQSSMYEI